MGSFEEAIEESKQLLEKGTIQKAYQGLMEFVRNFKMKYPEYSLPGNIYYGYMDMIYFSVIPEYLKQHKLKIAIVFDYETFRFEVWLSGFNRDVQVRFKDQIEESGWRKHHLTSNPKKDDYILEYVLVNDPDFGNLDDLTAQIEKGVIDFNRDIEQWMQKFTIE